MDARSRPGGELRPRRSLPPAWSPLYGDDGPARFTTWLRSPRELDFFALGDPSRAMSTWCDADGTRPLADVDALAEAADPHTNAAIGPERRACRRAFVRYAHDLVRRSGADAHVVHGRVAALTPAAPGWCVELEGGGRFGTRVVLLATGMVPHLSVPLPWQHWWRQLPPGSAELALRADARAEHLRRRRLAVLGSSNVSTWEAATYAARRGAEVTLLSRRGAPIERLLACDPAWIKEMAGEHVPETEEYDIRSTVFRARRPFHPGRLAAALDGPALRAAIRAKGIFWLANRPTYTGLLSKAGPSYVLEAMGPWSAVQSEHRWDLPEDEVAAVKADWHEYYGDRAQQLGGSVWASTSTRSRRRSRPP